MFPKNVPSGSSLALLLAVLLCAPLAARAGEKVTLRPWLEVEQGWDSNVYNLGDEIVFIDVGGSTCGGEVVDREVECNDERDSLVTYVRPGITFENAGELGHARLSLSAVSRTVWIESEMNTIDGWGNFDIERKLTSRFTILGAGSYGMLEGHDNVFSHDPSSSTVPLQPLSAAIPDVKRDNLMAGFRYALLPRTDMTLKGSAGRLNFERLDPELNPSFRTCLEEGTCLQRSALLNTGSTQYRDQDLRTAQLSFDHQLSQLDRIGLSFDYYGTDYQDLGVGERESSITNAELSWSHDWTQVWSSSISVGARYLDTSEKDVPSVGNAVCLIGVAFVECAQSLGSEDTSDNGLGVIGAVGIRGTFARSSISFSYSRDTRSTGGQFATDFDIDTFSVGYVNRLAERVTLRLNADYSFYDSVSDEIAPYPASAFGAVTCSLGGTAQVVAPPTGNQISGPVQCFGGSIKEERSYWTAHARLDWQLRKRLTAFGAIHYFAPDSERTVGGGAKSTTVNYDKWLLGLGMRYAWDLDF